MGSGHSRVSLASVRVRAWLAEGQGGERHRGCCSITGATWPCHSPWAGGGWEGAGWLGSRLFQLEGWDGAWPSQSATAGCRINPGEMLWGAAVLGIGVYTRGQLGITTAGRMLLGEPLPIPAASLVAPQPLALHP